MASLRDIRKRIKSVKNTQKITKAMKMVSAAKLRRAQESVEAARPYGQKVLETASALAKRGEQLGEVPHALLTDRVSKKHAEGKKPVAEIIVMTSDRGLCGGFNSNTVRRANRWAFDEKDNFDEVLFSTVGKKGRDLLKQTHTIREHHVGALENPTFAEAEEIAKQYCERYLDEDVELDAVFILYNTFKGGLELKQLLPVVPVEVEEHLVDYDYEPTRTELLDTLLPTHFATQLFVAFLETIASEHLARMMAMENATKNAGEMVHKLTLVYNRARQAAITTELGEIISGAEALK